MLESYKPLLDRPAHSAVELSTKFTSDKEAKPGIKAICRLITSLGKTKREWESTLPVSGEVGKLAPGKLMRCIGSYRPKALKSTLYLEWLKASNVPP
jgi:hypothetical protein